MSASTGPLRLVRAFWALAAANREAIVRALVMVTGVRIALWVLPSSLIVRGVRRLGASGDARRPPRLETARVIEAVEIVSRRVPGASCLTQAVSALLLLRHYGQQARLCIGVGRDGGGDFRAHAWLEQEDRILIGAPGAAQLTRLVEFGAGAGSAAARGRP